MLKYGSQDIQQEEADEVARVLRGDWLTTGPAVEEFEQHLQTWTNRVPVVAVSSGTAALHCAYFAAGIRPGDEVITPPITFVATQAAAINLGARIVFADVNDETITLDPAAVEAAISSRTVAIVAVDYAGHPADMTALRRIATRYGLLLIEDASHSLGSTWRGVPTGSLADITTFSFFPTKNITTCEGGAVAASDPVLLERARKFAHQGMERDSSRFMAQPDGPWYQEVQAFGLNYRMPDPLARLGTLQLQRLETFRRRRLEIKDLYDDLLGGIAQVVSPVQAPGAEVFWHLYAARFPQEMRRSIFEALRSEGIQTQVNYLPAYRHPAFLNHYNPRDFPISENFYEQELSLPLHTQMTDSDVTRIVTIIKHTMETESQDAP